MCKFLLEVWWNERICDFLGLKLSNLHIQIYRMSFEVFKQILPALEPLRSCRCCHNRRCNPSVVVNHCPLCIDSSLLSPMFYPSMEYCHENSNTLFRRAGEYPTSSLLISSAGLVLALCRDIRGSRSHWPLGNGGIGIVNTRIRERRGSALFSLFRFALSNRSRYFHGRAGS